MPASHHSASCARRSFTISRNNGASIFQSTGTFTVSVGPGYTSAFHGNPKKGLLVVASTPWTVECLDPAPGIDWVLPVRVSGPRPFNLLAIWTIDRPEWPKPYARQVELAIDAYAALLAAGDTIIAGDFNTFPGGSHRTAHLRNVTRLGELGLTSAYHHAKRTEHGDEPEGTLYWKWQLDQPFHCDFAFIPETWSDDLIAVTIGNPNHWVTGKLSDHCPVIVDFATRGV